MIAQAARLGAFCFLVGNLLAKGVYADESPSDDELSFPVKRQNRHYGTLLKKRCMFHIAPI